MATFATVAEVVNDAGKELGLWTADVTDPFASTDASVVQMLALLKRLGRKLVRDRQWTHLQTQYTFVTVSNQADYPLPSDFDSMINQSGWNRTNRLPFVGPLSPQEWQYLKARLVGVVFTVLFRPKDGVLTVYPDVNTPGGYTIAFEYISNAWILKADTSTATAPTAATDTVRFDAEAVTTGLKLSWLKAKGFDTTAAQDDFDAALAQDMDADSAAPVLRLNQGTQMEPLVGAANIPITGFGGGT